MFSIYPFAEEERSRSLMRSEAELLNLVELTRLSATLKRSEILLGIFLIATISSERLKESLFANSNLRREA
ncbi:MAG: hypothetical protein BWY21_02041 [Parcubacteria group bacterium ADurb.Bin216]|nr:MAG: hypothetical protein BWY21_02041 [Parcubacteria group bacterium ADurb.Bin216]